jgi:hypothetical protein
LDHVQFIKLCTGEELIVTCISPVSDQLNELDIAVKNCVVLLPQQTPTGININLVPWPMWSNSVLSAKGMPLSVLTANIVAFGMVPKSLEDKYMQVFSKVIIPKDISL